MSLSRKISSGMAVCLVATLMSNAASATLVALKRDSGLVHANGTGAGDADTNLHTDFQGLGAADVQTTTVNDTFLWNTGGAAWQNFGATASYSGDGAAKRSFLVKFDLSSLADFSGATINKAEIRLWMSGGNTNPAGLSVGAINTHDWVEGNKAGVYPGLPAAAFGASAAHPSGINSNANRDSSGGTTGNLSSWGASADAKFSITDDTTVSPSATRSGTGATQWFVYDVKSAVQGWADGTANYGIAAKMGNNTFHASEGGTKFEPVLFVDYKVTSVPEPSSFLFFSALTLGLGWSRKRKS